MSTFVIINGEHDPINVTRDEETVWVRHTGMTVSLTLTASQRKALADALMFDPDQVDPDHEGLSCAELAGGF